MMMASGYLRVETGLFIESRAIKAAAYVSRFKMTRRRSGSETKTRNASSSYYVETIENRGNDHQQETKLNAGREKRWSFLSKKRKLGTGIFSHTRAAPAHNIHFECRVDTHDRRSSPSSLPRRSISHSSPSPAYHRPYQEIDGSRVAKALLRIATFLWSSKSGHLGLPITDANALDPSFQYDGGIASARSSRGSSQGLVSARSSLFHHSSAQSAQRQLRLYSHGAGSVAPAVPRSGREASLMWCSEGSTRLISLRFDVEMRRTYLDQGWRGQRSCPGGDVRAIPSAREGHQSL